LVVAFADQPDLPALQDRDAVPLQQPLRRQRRMRQRAIVQAGDEIVQREEIGDGDAAGHASSLWCFLKN
jgi:hypothetical protein